MANIKHTYNICPTWNFPPDGPIQLGNVLWDYKLPHEPLSRPDAARLATQRAWSTTKDGYSYSPEKKKDWRLSFATKLLSNILGVGVDVSLGSSNRYLTLHTRPVFRIATFENCLIFFWFHYSHVAFRTVYLHLRFPHQSLSPLCLLSADIGCLLISISNKQALVFASLETNEIELQNEFVRHCMEIPEVREFVAAGVFFKSPLYIITGLMIGRGAKSGKTVEASSRELGASIEVDPTLWSGGSTPVSAGPEVSSARSWKTGTSWEGGTDFVLAYRLRRVKLSRAGEVKSNKEWTKGTVLGSGDLDKEDHESHFAFMVEEEDFLCDSDDYSIKRLEECFPEGEIFEFAVPLELLQN